MKVHQLSIVLLSQLLWSKSEQFFDLLITFHTIFKSCLSFPIRCITNSFPFGIRQLADSLDEVPPSGNEVGNLIREKLCQYSASSILVCSIQAVHQTILSKPHVPLGRPLHLINYVSLSVQTERFLFLIEKHVQQKNLD